MLGITNHSKVPLRLMAMGGFLLSFISLLVAIIFFGKTCFLGFISTRHSPDADWHLFLWCYTNFLYWRAW